MAKLHLQPDLKTCRLKSIYHYLICHYVIKKAFCKAIVANALYKKFKLKMNGMDCMPKKQQYQIENNSTLLLL
ncbi:MAG: hypothetical protein WCG93_03100 [Paludibacter sp.]